MAQKPTLINQDANARFDALCDDVKQFLIDLCSRVARFLEHEPHHGYKQLLENESE